MEFLRKVLVFVAFATICIHLAQGQGHDTLVMQRISLNDATPQAIVHLPPGHLQKEDSYACHYWISFLNDIPEDAKPRHEKFGISVVPMNMELKDGESIVLMGHPVNLKPPEEGANVEFENITLDSKSGLSEFKPMYQDVCIQLKGDWGESSTSEATLLITLFYNTDTNDKECPDGMSKCTCGSESKRCISNDLICNGVQNCGLDCKHDETETACKKDGHENSESMQTINLSEVTPQGVIRLPPDHRQMEEHHACHYWISFLNSIPEDAKPYHKSFGISVVASGLELTDGDSIFIMAHPIDGNNTIPEFEKVEWDANSGSNLEFKPMYQDICIILRGDWESSKATILATMFYDNSKVDENYCPSGMTKCQCDSQRRCISEDLICNGQVNCGVDCKYDESKLASCNNGNDDSHENSGVMQTVSLSEATPQGVLRLPPDHRQMEENHVCHYWISFLNSISDDAKPYHKSFGISVVASDVDLKDGDSIFVMAHPIDGNNTIPEFEKVEWDANSGSKLEFKPMYQDICIILRGDWESSKATILATMFYDNSKVDENYCPSGMSRCQCASQNNRCISQDLFCNGVDNCGLNCPYDESALASCSKKEEGGHPELPNVLKVVTLNEMASQALVHLPPAHPELEDNYLCHYWISFLKEIPESAIPYHKDFGISVVASNVELNDGASIFLMAHPVDGNNTVPEFEKVTWDSESGSSLEFKPKYQDICINLKGDWKSSKASLLVTLFYDNADMHKDCPSGMAKCSCSSQNTRCISEDLICNGVGNCGIDCRFDEEQSSCALSKNTVVKDSCSWSNLEYYLMMVMTGLLLILIPAVFLLTFMYHKRLNRQRLSPASFDGNYNFNRSTNGQHSHVISMPPPNDIPPRYDEFSVGDKIPLGESDHQQTQA